MLRTVSSRNSRSKGLKVKNALQLFLLSAVTIWLLYQVKHSYDKKESYDQNKENSLSSIKDGLSNTPGEESITPDKESIRFGRKDIADTEIERKGKKNSRIVTRKSERDTNLDETYGDEEIAEIIEEAEAEDSDESEKGETEKDESDADTEETSLFEDEETGKDEIREARERTFHQDNVASAVAHDVNMTSLHEDYLDSKEKFLTNVSMNDESSASGLVIGNGLDNKTDNGTGIAPLSRLNDKPVSVNLTNGIVVNLNGTGTVSNTPDLDLKPVSVNLTNGIVVNLNGTGTVSNAPDSDLNAVERKSKVNVTIVVGTSNSTKVVGTTDTSVSLSPANKGDGKKRDSGIKIKGANGEDVVFQ